MSEEQKLEETGQVVQVEEQNLALGLGCLKWFVLGFAGLVMFTCGSCFLTVFDPKIVGCEDFCEKELRRNVPDENAVQLCKWHCRKADGKCPPAHPSLPKDPGDHSEWGGCADSWVDRYNPVIHSHSDYCLCGEKFAWPW